MAGYRYKYEKMQEVQSGRHQLGWEQRDVVGGEFGVVEGDAEGGGSFFSVMISR